ncbi:MAG: LPS assembly protein LptD, partial [Pseudomonadota bacterium]
MRLGGSNLRAGVGRAALTACLGALLVWPVGDVALAQDPNIGAATSATPAPVRDGEAQTPFGSLVRPDTNQPLNLEGDELIYDSAGQRVTARGNVEILFNNYVLKADEVVYDQAAGTLTALGNVTLREPGGTVTSGDRITLTDDFRDGFIEALSVRTADNSRITARRAIRRDGNVSVFEDGKFTPCKTENGQPPLWCLSAERVIHDQQAATITYENASFDIFGQPILFLPFFQHADPSVKRKSGFLQPSFRHSESLGFQSGIPYYFALSPSYDFLFKPSYLTEQGFLFEGTWRQKLAIGSVRGEYNIELAAIDQKRSGLPSASDDLVGFRGSLKTRGDFSLSSWWKFGWDVTIESDDTFRSFYKLDSVILRDRVNSVFMVGQSERNYLSIVGYQFGGLSLTETAASESIVHPVIDWNYVFANSILGGELSFDVNAVSLSRDFTVNTTDSATSSNSRLSVDVNWRRRLTDQIGITYTPFANLRGDLISVNDSYNGVDTAILDDQSRARGYVAAGLTAEYPWLARTTSASHVVSPIGQVIARTGSNADDQAELPNEDARSLVFDDTNLFEVDKFSGFDRIETGSRANVGLQYTFQADNGGHARILAGLSFRLDDENPFERPGQIPVAPADPAGGIQTEPTFNEDNGLDTRRSDVVVGAYLSPNSMFQVISQARFDESGFGLRQADIFARVAYG